MIPHRGLFALSKDIPAIKVELREKVGKLSYIDVRRNRMKLYDALNCELLEDGCIISAAHLTRLAQKENYLYEMRIIKKKVIQSNSLLVAIVDNVRFAEKLCKIGDDRAHSLIVIAQTAQLIEARGEEYNWLTKEFYIIINDLLAEWGHPLPFSEIECRTKYYYGKFLLKKEKNYLEAIEQLKRALELARGKPWFTNNESSNIIHLKSTTNLCKAYLFEANRIEKKSPEEAEQLAQQAVLVLSEAGDAKNKILYCEANLKRCHYLIRCKHFDQTINTHKKLQSYIYSIGSPAYKCEMFLQQGICFLSQNNDTLALRKLKQAIRLGEIYNLKYFKGHALVHVGKLYSKVNATFPLAQNYLKQAKQTFFEIDDKVNATKVNYLAAVIKTQDILPELLHIMRNSDCFCNMLILRAWKDQCRSFWKEKPDQIEQIEDKEIPIEEEQEPETTEIITTSHLCIFHDMDIIG